MNRMSHSNVHKLGPLQILLLAVPCVAVLIVPFYNRIEPALYGIPFLYWWLGMWAPLSSLFIALAYKTSSRAS
ncbi:MAG TPA: DUF3311 domain-containing protein [Burkholderiales bacterium]|nr:DUF3311 domain-containing protein [Burkholderiales bacterium]